MEASDDTPDGGEAAIAGVLADVAGPERVTRLLPLAQRLAVFEGKTVDVLGPADIGAPAALDAKKLEALVQAALSPAGDESFVWVDGDSELAVHAGRTRVALLPGALVLGIAVECDQTGEAEVTVPFALGTDKVEAGMVMTAPARADGPATVIDRWGPILVAAAYRAVLDVTTAAAAAAGVDRDGRRLIPGAISTDGRSLAVLPQARHLVDRGRLL